MIVQRTAESRPLGAVPLIPVIVAGGVAAGTGGTLLAQWAWRKAQETSALLAQTIGLTPTPVLAPTPSTSGPPPAPRTAEKLTSWKPEDIFEAQAQRTQAEQRVTAQLTAQPAAKAAPGTDSTPWLIAAGVVGAISLVLILTR